MTTNQAVKCPDIVQCHICFEDGHWSDKEIDTEKRYLTIVDVRTILDGLLEQSIFSDFRWCYITAGLYKFRWVYYLGKKSKRDR